MQTHRSPWTLAALALAAAAAPMTGTAQQPEKDAAVAMEESVTLPEPTVTVANHNWLDMHVYLVRAGGGRTSLGIVTSHQTERFEIPAGFMSGPSDLHIVADPIGSRRSYVSPSFFPDPGTDFAVDLHASLGLSWANLRHAAAN